MFELRVGDCFDDDEPADEIDEVTVVPCTEAHDSEVHLVVR